MCKVPPVVPIFAVTPQVFPKANMPGHKGGNLPINDFNNTFITRFLENPGAIIWDAESEENNGASVGQYILDTDLDSEFEDIILYIYKEEFSSRLQKIPGSPKIKSFESETYFIEKALDILRQPDSFLDGIIISEEYKAAIAEFDPQGLEDQTESSPDENPGLEEGDAESVQEVASEDTDAHPEGSSFEKDGENGDSATAQEVPEVEPEPDRCEINSEGVEAENKPLEESDEE